MPLSLTRVPGETIVLTTRDGQRITIGVEPTPERGLEATLVTIDAPRDITILRGELGDPR